MFNIIRRRFKYKHFFIKKKLFYKKFIKQIFWQSNAGLFFYISSVNVYILSLANWQFLNAIKKIADINRKK